jgi:hypothetical protein
LPFGLQEVSVHRAIRSVFIIGFISTTWLTLDVKSAEAQQLRIENAYPRQLPIGQTTIVNAVLANPNDVKAAEVSPSQGVTVSAISRGDSFQGALTWWSITIEVAKDAAPGDRTLVLQLPAGRTIPTSLTIPSHVPRIADLRIRDGRSNPAAFDVEVAAIDDSADLGAAPHVWFMMACGDMPLPGVVRGTVAQGVVRATVPYPLVAAGTSAAAKCNLQLRVADSHGNESNTLRTTVDAPSRGPQPQVAPSAADTGGGDWTEVVSQEERFTLTFPGKPVIADTTFFSQYGAALPARVYRVATGGKVYSLTVVDYNPVERLLVERSRSCPIGANTCQGIADWGVGYWKTDIRGALLYAVWKLVERDAKVTTVSWNGIALVQGVEMRLTNNADQSRTFASIYMHENRLLIVEATVPRGDAPPVSFNESLNWLDESGRPVRYQTTYVNIPDVPKPPPRGGQAPAPVSR